MNPQKYHQRKSPRLKDYDYAQNGAYFVTICTQNRLNLFGHIGEDGVMHLNDFGEIVLACWNDLPNHYKNIELDVFVVMPNHIHGIILIIDTKYNHKSFCRHFKRLRQVSTLHECLKSEDLCRDGIHAIRKINIRINVDVLSVREGFKPSLTKDPATRKQHSLTEIVRALKTFSSRRINEKRNQKGFSVWQRSFHDHIIRNETELNKLREYVLYNASLWAEDKYHSDT